MLLVLSCTTSNYSANLDVDGLISKLEGQRLYAILYKNINEMDIPSEYYFEDCVITLYDNGNYIIIYDYDGKLQYEKHLIGIEKEKLFNILNDTK